MITRYTTETYNNWYPQNAEISISEETENKIIKDQVNLNNSVSLEPWLGPPGLAGYTLFL